MDYVDDEDLLRIIENNILNSVTLSGNKQIREVFMRKPDSDDKKKAIIEGDGRYRMRKDWILETVGTSLLEVCLVLHAPVLFLFIDPFLQTLADKDVDATRTYSNSIYEIYEILGVEAARRAIEREMKEVLSFDGSYVNYHHLSLLCDVMTMKGKTLYGILYVLVLLLNFQEL